MLQNDRLLRVLQKQPVDRTPIWVMRQAGRYLPEYRKTRQQAGSFMQLCQTPELACEVTLQPLARYPLDAAIIFSDILTIPDAMGLGLYFEEGVGPKFKQLANDEASIAKLPVLDPNIELRYVMDAIRLTKQSLQNKVPLIGFAGSPWTIATYMVEGGPTKTHATIKKMMYRQPALLQQLLDCLVENISQYLLAQVEAGADCLMIFDTWGGVLGQAEYHQFSLQPMAEIVERLQAKTQIPLTLFSKNGGKYLTEIAATGCHGIGLDWTADLGFARREVGHQVALQGNLDPCVLYAEPKMIRERVYQLLQSFGVGEGHIFNLGHGIYPDVSTEHMAALIEAVHALSPQFHVNQTKGEQHG